MEAAARLLPAVAFSNSSNYFYIDACLHGCSNTPSELIKAAPTLIFKSMAHLTIVCTSPRVFGFACNNNPSKVSPQFLKCVTCRIFDIVTSF